MTIAEHFKGLAEPTRLRMLNLLLHGELCGCDLQYVLDLPQSNVSRHLNYLKRVGLVKDRREGYRVFYRLADTSDRSRALLLDYPEHVFSRDAMFTSDLKDLRLAVRDGACTVSDPHTSKLKSTASERRQSP